MLVRSSQTVIDKKNLILFSFLGMKFEKVGTGLLSESNFSVRNDITKHGLQQ